jgi:quinate dehydrogenase (quinone)
MPASVLAAGLARADVCRDRPGRGADLSDAGACLGRVRGRGAYGLAGILAVGVVATLAYMFVPTHVVKATTEPAVTPVAPGTEQKDWAHWGNTTAGNRFAALDQINKGNIDKLQVAWTFRTGDIPQSTGAGAEDQNTPLQIGNTVYICTAYGKVFALDADTGAQRWKFDPQGSAPNWQRCRGLGYSEAPAPGCSTNGL